MKYIDRCTAIPGHKDFVYFDVGKRLKAGEANKIFASPAVVQLVKTVMHVLDQVLTELLDVNRDQVERIGIVLDDGVHGVFIPNPGRRGYATILINPFELLRGNMVDSNGVAIPTAPRGTPDRAAMGVYHTAIHEA